MKMVMIGSRGHWQYVFGSINEVPEVKITGVASGSEDNTEVLEARCIEYGFEPKVYDDWRHMLKVEKPDIVCVDGPFHLHAEMCVEALNRNINVFCEKPIATTLPQLAEIEEALRGGTAKIFSMVGLRYAPPFQTAIGLIRNGAIGKVKMISARKSYKLGQRADFYKKRETYGGTIPWVGSHAIDWIIAVSGSRFKRVWSIQNREDNCGHGELEVSAQCLFELTGGIVAQASIDYLRPAASPTHGDDRLRVAGTKGVIEVACDKIILTDSDGEHEIASIHDRNLFSDIIMDIGNKREALIDSRQTIELTRACLLAQKSADENQIVSFPDDIV